MKRKVPSLSFRASTLDNMIRTWKEQGRTKAEIIVLQAEAMLGWPYVWGAAGPIG